ncbi:MAG TPA: hypothetical protein PLE05_11335 [Bacillota bacterium]|nr:hypothetical protein [Bacillota bacterium]
MARELQFKLGDSVYSFSPDKVDRKKIYVWTETVALDDDGNECKLVSVDESGTAIIPKGCIGLGILSQSNEWVERSELVAVDSDGNPANLIPSSFSGVIELAETVTVEEFLDYQITTVYELYGADENPDFIKEISDKIYTFSFNYRDGYESSQAFILQNEGKAFVLVGTPCEFDFIGLEQAGYLDTAEEDEEFSEELDIDFSMM